MLQVINFVAYKVKFRKSEWFFSSSAMQDQSQKFFLTESNLTSKAGQKSYGKLPY